ncbi:lipase family protein [Providencia rettgeri]|uniref:lipase family protein n=1 Tax=Providencia sp. PROV178 TaxID=2949881 RepID=UPI00227463B9|nr:lipase family protein [Providencia sp. PROV178]MDB9568606.1 lipase family protein [Providencia rettgeri]
MPYQYNDPYCADCSKRKAWIECVLVDEQNQPLAGLSYTLKVRNGVIRKGVTDAQGYLRQEDLPRTVATLTIESQKLTDEMEKRPLRTLRGEAHSTVKPDALLQGYSYRYAVIGELCDKAPDINQWQQARFGLPYYHFPKENEFNGLKLIGEDFNQRHVIEVCPFRAWSLILSHTPDYDMVNAYNLGLMSLLVYKDETMIDPDEIEDMREFINTPNTTTSFFYQQCFDLSTSPIMTDGYDYPAIVTDVPFKERYRPAIYLDLQQVENAPKFEHDTQMFYVENDTQIIAAWRGTASVRDALTDATYRPIPCPKSILSAQNAKVHKGFLDAYQCVEKYFPVKIKRIDTNSKTKELFITGHSLGGALALLHASELRDNNPLLYTYGSPRVFTGSGVNALASVNHFRHVNDADTVTSVPFDTNMDNWLFNLYGPLGTVFGFSWTLATLPTIPLQKAFPDMGEVYYHHGNTVSFFEARQIGEDPKYPVGDGAGTVRARWRMNGNYKFYLVPDIANKLNGQLEQEQKNYIHAIKADRTLIDEIFPKGNNPSLDTIMTMATDHSMASKYQVIMNNRLLSVLEPTKTPKLSASKQRFEELIHHKDAYPLNAQRNTTFIALENALKNEVKRSTEKNDILKQALERHKDETHEI